MHYQEYPPKAALSPYVSCIWTLADKVEQATFTPTIERILPDGQMEMIFHLGDRFHQVLDGNKILQARSFIYGQLHQFLDLLPPANTRIIAFRFYPFGLSPFLPLSPKELQQAHISLEELYGRAGKELEDRVNYADSVQSAIAVVEQFLVDRLGKARLQDPFIAHISELIIRSRGVGDIQDIIQSYKVSPRHFQRKFLAITGTKPKTLARITRLQNALQLAQQRPHWNLTELSLATGYFDQSHFIRDFKRFAGMSPGKFFQQAYQLNDQFVGS